MKKNNTAATLMLLAVLIISAVLSINLFMRQRTDHDSVDIHTLPLVINGWQGKELAISERDYSILETRNLIFREYDKEGRKIYLFIVYSETNRSVFHPPEVCLIGAGVAIENKTSQKMSVKDIEFMMNKLDLAEDGRKEVALYVYKAGSFYTDSYYLQQLYFAVNQLLGRRQGGATIRVSATVSGTEEETTAELKGFISDIIKELESLK